MKKFLFYTFLVVSLFYYNNVSASSTSSNFDAYFDEDFNEVMEAVYNTSNDFINDKMIGYEYSIVWLDAQKNQNNNYNGSFVDLYIANYNGSPELLNTFRSGNYPNGLRLNYAITCDMCYKYEFYYNNGKLYSDSNLTNELSVITESQKILGQQLTANSSTYLTFRQIYGNGRAISGNISSNSSDYVPYNIYYNNISLGSPNYLRSLTLYNLDLNIIDTYNSNSVPVAYIDIFHDVPSYLNGYKKITISEGTRYYILSDITSGNVYVPFEYYQKYYTQVVYYDNDLSYQPYNAVIEDFTNTPDRLFVKFSFDLSSYIGADFILISKYDYLEGEDDISYDIYVPSDSYDSAVTITTNSIGGNNFSFDFKDSDGVIQTELFENHDLSILQQNELFADLYQNFASNYFGLSSILTRPLDVILKITDDSCSNVVLPLPFINRNITLPCMSEIYSNYFGIFFTIYQGLVSGFISYWILIDMVRIVKGFKDPSYDKIEVLRL